MFCRNMFFQIFNSILLAVFSCLDNKLSTCTKVLQWAVNMSVTGFVLLSVSRWFVCIFFSSLVQQTSFTLPM